MLVLLSTLPVLGAVGAEPRLEPEAPPAGPAVISLGSASGQRWTLRGTGPHPVAKPTPARVPGDITDDMLRAGELGVSSLWFGDNAREAPWWV
jgi:hypothetical protein